MPSDSALKRTSPNYYTKLKSHYHAGLRAGLCGTSYADCPFKGLHSLLWYEGWDKGITHRINTQRNLIHKRSYNT